MQRWTPHHQAKSSLPDADSDSSATLPSTIEVKRDPIDTRSIADSRIPNPKSLAARSLGEGSGRRYE